MRVLICGGGCAGPALAFWLVRLGHQVVIVERAPDLRAAGAQIDFREQGITTLKRMGLIDDIRARLVDEAGVSIVDEDGRAWATLFANKTGHGPQGPTSEFEIMRADLVQLLYEKTKNDVEYVFGKSVDHFEQDDERVDVHFSDGTSDVFDLVVGADGQGSRIRKAILPENVDPYLHTGFHVAYFFVPRIPSDTNIRDVYQSPGGRQIMRRSHNPEETQVYFIYRDDSPDVRAIHRAPEARQKEFWKQRYQGAGWQTERFLSEIDGVENWYSAEVVQVRVDRWHKGRVVLLGDAAYGPSLLSGMGTTASFVGAYVLAGELSKSPDDVRTALGNYEQTLRPFVEDCQNINFGLRKFFVPMTAWGISLIRWVLWLMCFLRMPALKARFGSEEKAGWALPDYPELKASNAS